MTQPILGVIGGSGLYEMQGLEGVEEFRVTTPFGDPSDAIIGGRLGATQLFFVARHGRGHHLPPHRINYRANVLALKQLGVEQIISVSAVGSMKESIAPGDMVLVDQFVDRTRGRANTFFEDDGVVAHVGFADPVDDALRECLYRAAIAEGAKAHNRGTYVCIEGPQFSTRAESLLYRSWGVDVVGMTNLPEARLAREAELPYATRALATDYDGWHQEQATVSVEAVLEIIERNIATAKKIIAGASQRLPDPAASPARTALAHAIMTDPGRISDAARKKLASLIGSYLR